MTAPASVIGKLRTSVRGRVSDDENSLLQCSRDQSMYEIKPLAAFFPEDPEDVMRIVGFAAREGVPITARGGGSGTAGSALGTGIIIALPENPYWGRISGFAEEHGKVRVSAGAGVLHNDLQEYLRKRGFFLPADVGSAAISRIGGNIATKASGPHALKYGSIDRFLDRVEFITARGELVDTEDEKTIPGWLKNGLAGIMSRLRSDEEAQTLLQDRSGLKTSSGYNLFAFLGDPGTGKLISRLIAGSVGTLGLITAAVLRAERYPRERAALIAYFNDLSAAAEAVGVLRELDVAAIELISRDTIAIIGKRTALPAGLAADSHVLLVEATGPGGRDVVEKAASLLRDGSSMAAQPAVASSENEIEDLWTVRKQVLWLVEHPEPGFRALAVVNDVGVPLERLARFVADVQKVFADHRITAPVYGHAGNGNLHLRPLFDLSLPDLPGRVRRLADDIYGTVIRHHGTITAEHGMGRLRAPYLRQEWGGKLYGYMQEVKTLFDPEGLLNPGVMFGSAPITDNMREDLMKP